MPPSTFRASAEKNQSPTFVSGSFQLSFTNTDGTSEYTILYRYPLSVVLGSNFTIQVTVFVDMLSGLKLYLIDYGLTVSIFGSSGQVAMKQVLSNPGMYLYAGSHWGPMNISIPISGPDFQNAQGDSNIANVSLQFVGDVWYDIPVNWHYYDSGTRGIGNITIESSVGRIFPIAVVVTSASILAIVGITIFMIVCKMRRRSVRRYPLTSPQNP